jgi:hypothetical protein
VIVDDKAGRRRRDLGLHTRYPPRHSKARPDSEYSEVGERLHKVVDIEPIRPEFGRIPATNDLGRFIRRTD